MTQNSLSETDQQELQRLRAGNKRLKTEREMLKSQGLLCQGIELKNKFASAQKAEHMVTDLCRVMEKSTSGYYVWLKRLPSEHYREGQKLFDLIRPIFDASQKSYGSPHIHATLKERGTRLQKSASPESCRRTG